MATVVNIIQTASSPYEYECSWWHREKPYIATYRQHKVDRPWLGSNQHCISQHSTESVHYPTMPVKYSEEQVILYKVSMATVCLHEIYCTECVHLQRLCNESAQNHTVWFCVSYGIVPYDFPYRLRFLRNGSRMLSFDRSDTLLSFHP